MYVMYFDCSDLPTPRSTLTEFGLCCPECEAMFLPYQPTRDHLLKENLTVLTEAIIHQESLSSQAACLVQAVLRQPAAQS